MGSAGCFRPAWPRSNSYRARDEHLRHKGVAGLLVGCGGSDDESAKSQSNGVAQRGTAVDLRYSRDAGTVGTVTVNGQAIQLVFRGQDLFFKASKDTWTELTGDDRAGEVIGDR